MNDEPQPLRFIGKEPVVYRRWRELSVKEWTEVSKQVALAAIAVLLANGTTEVMTGKNLRDHALSLIGKTSGPPKGYTAQKMTEPGGKTYVRVAPTVRNVSPEVEKFARFRVELPRSSTIVEFAVPDAGVDAPVPKLVREGVRKK